MRRFVALLALALSLAGCGGGGGGGDPPDAGYGTGGYALLAGLQSVSGMAVASDGSVFITGQAIVKLDPRGALDASFGSGGRVALRSASPVLDEAGNLFVISGVEVAKIDPSGRLALAFGVNGRATIGEGWREVFDMPTRLVRDREGNLFVAAARGIGPFSLEIVKLDRDGRRVAAYGNGGALSVSNGRRLSPIAMALDSQGNLYAGGVQSIPVPGTNSFLMIVKADRDGRLDPAFGDSGIWLDTSCTTFSGVRSIAIDAADQLVIGGECHPFSLGLALATVRRLDSRGNALPFADPRYELFGMSVPPGPVIEAREASAVLVRADGRIYAAGHRLSGHSCAEPAVAKLEASGALVPDFGVAGKLGLGTTGFVRGMGMDSAGRIYVGVATFAACPAVTLQDFVVYRLGG